jgi:tetratricopeptide (TPR) repeat protein
MYEWYDGDPGWLSQPSRWTEALDRDPRSVAALFGIAMVYFHQGRFGDARRTLLSVLQTDPQHVPARIRLGVLAERTAAGREEALAYYREAVDLRPNDEEAWRCLAAVHQKLGDRDAAQEASLNVVEITTRKLEASLGRDPAEPAGRGLRPLRPGRPRQRVLELAPAGLALYIVPLPTPCSVRSTAA